MPGLSSAGEEGRGETSSLSKKGSDLPDSLAELRVLSYAEDRIAGGAP
jgi:hypothetical protein